MKKAVYKSCKTNESKVSVVTPNVADILKSQDCDDFDKTDFFYPTAPAVYKNNSLIFEACKILDRENLNYKVTLTLPEDTIAPPKVACIGRIPYDEVIKKYCSETLVFPSYIESFGCPLAEAKMLNSVILASDCPFSHEILDGYPNAYFFDYKSPEQLAGLMQDVIDGRITKNELPKSKVKQINSWQAVIKEIVV